MSEAARRLQYTPAAVSQHIAALERQVGAPLLVRHARGVRPTPAGALLARHAAAIDRTLDDAADDLRALLSRSRSVVRVGAFASAAVGFVPRVLTAFRRAFPGVEALVEEQDADASVDAVRAGRLDLAITFEPTDAPDLPRDGVDLRVLARDPLDVLLPRRHRMARAAAVRLEQLAGDKWVSPRGATCAGQLERGCAAAGFVPTVAFITEDHRAARAAVSSGLAVAMAPRMLCEADDEAVVVRPLERAPARDVIVATRSEECSSVALALRQAFIDDRSPASSSSSPLHSI